MSELNCNRWAEVDFGNGPVEVRCTEAGEHDVHKCNVIFLTVTEENPDFDPEAAEAEHKSIMAGSGEMHNVFDQGRSQE